MITVQELIDKLNKIKDKQKKILVVHTYDTDEYEFNGIEEFYKITARKVRNL